MKPNELPTFLLKSNPYKCLTEVILQQFNLEAGMEDDRYVLSFMHEYTSELELVIVNATDMQVEASMKLPSRVPYGFHETFISSKDLESRA